MPRKPKAETLATREVKWKNASTSADREWRASERRDLAEQLVALGRLDVAATFDFGSDRQTLALLRERAAAGDRSAMLAILSLAARTLHAFDALTDDVRIGIGNALSETVAKLREDDFLPKKRGRPKSTAQEGKFLSLPEAVALAVETRRRDEVSLDAAIVQIAEQYLVSEAAVKKYWNQHHKQAKGILASIDGIQTAVQAVKSSVGDSKVTKMR